MAESAHSRIDTGLRSARIATITVPVVSTERRVGAAGPTSSR